MSKRVVWNSECIAEMPPQKRSQWQGRKYGNIRIIGVHQGKQGFGRIESIAECICDCGRYFEAPLWHVTGTGRIITDCNSNDCKYTIIRQLNEIVQSPSELTERLKPKYFCVHTCNCIRSECERLCCHECDKPCKQCDSDPTKCGAVKRNKQAVNLYLKA